MKIALLALVVAGGLWADDATSTYFTDGMANGHYWQALDASGKLAFLAGFDNGAAAAIMEHGIKQDPTKAFSSIWAPNPAPTRGDAMDWLDEFYQHPENRTLSIRVAILLFYAKLSGKSAECLQAETAFWRATMPSPEFTMAMEAVQRFCYGRPKDGSTKKPEVTVFK